MDKNLAYEILGWIGTVMVLLAYALNSFGTLSAQSVMYQAMNIIGSAGLLTIALAKKVYQSVAINVFWGAIAVISLLNLII